MNTKENETGRRPGLFDRTPEFSALCLCVLGILLYLFILPSACSPSGGNQTLRNSANARQVLIACRTYAADNNGHFPDKLHHLIRDQYIVAPEVLKYLNRRGAQVTFTYIGAGLKDDVNTIILYSDPGPDNRSVIGYSDGRVEMVKGYPKIP